MRKVAIAFLLIFTHLTLAQENKELIFPTPLTLDELKTQLDYDRTIPIDFQITDTKYYDGFLIHEINFASPVKSRVSGNIIAPLDYKEKKYPSIIFMHWGQGDRSEFIWEASLYAKAGAVCLTLDATWVRPGDWRGAGEGVSNGKQTKKMFIQNMIEVRRSIDLLIEYANIDKKNIGYVAHSFGATWAGTLSAVEKRFKTIIMMGGLPSLTEFNLLGARRFDERNEMLKLFISHETLQTYIDEITPISSIYFIQHAAPASVFMQYAEFDSFISKAAADAYYNKTSEPKLVKWYFTSHEFQNPEALIDRANWLKDKLGIDEIKLNFN